MKEFNIENWEKDYPKMPASFHQALVREIEKQTAVPEEAREESAGRTRRTGRTGTRRAGKRRARWIVIGAAAVLCTMTAFAATRLHLAELFDWGSGSAEAEKLIQTEPEVTQPETPHASAAAAEYPEEAGARQEIPDASALLEIREVMFDGGMLYVYAVPTENGKQYDLGTDRMYVDGREVGPVSTGNYKAGEVLNGTALEQETYTFQADLSDLHLTEDFEATLPLSVYEKAGQEKETGAMDPGGMASYQAPYRYQNQDLTFSVSVTDRMRHFADQAFSCDEFHLEVTEFYVMATAVKAVFTYQMTEEQQAAFLDSGESFGIPVLKNARGEVLEMRQGQISEMDGEGRVRIEAEYENRDLTEAGDTCEIVTEWYNRFQEGRTAAESTFELTERTEEAAVPERPDRIRGSFSGEEGTLTIDADVVAQEAALFAGTLEQVPFRKELVKGFFGEPEYWSEQEEFGKDTLVYDENGLFEKSVILGYTDETGSRFSMEMSLRSSEEYGQIRNRMKVKDTPQALELMGVSAEVTGWSEMDHCRFETLQGTIDGVLTAFYSPVASTGTITYEYGDMTVAQFYGNYKVTEKEAVKLLPMEELLDCVQTYVEDGTIPLCHADGATIQGEDGVSLTYGAEEMNTVHEAELQYYLEKNGDQVTFRPVWVFKIPNILNLFSEENGEEARFPEDAFYVDAQDGSYVSSCLTAPQE